MQFAMPGYYAVPVCYYIRVVKPAILLFQDTCHYNNPVLPRQFNNSFYGLTIRYLLSQVFQFSFTEVFQKGISRSAKFMKTDHLSSYMTGTADQIFHNDKINVFLTIFGFKLSHRNF